MELSKIGLDVVVPGSTQSFWQMVGTDTDESKSSSECYLKRKGAGITDVDYYSVNNIVIAQARNSAYINSKEYIEIEISVERNLRNSADELENMQEIYLALDPKDGVLLVSSLIATLSQIGIDVPSALSEVTLMPSKLYEALKARGGLRS